MSDFSSDGELDAAQDELDLNFNQAAEHVQRIHTKCLPNDLLELYALYKQGTIGRCNTTKPGIFNLQARSKWCAWQDLGDLAKNEAKSRYIEKVKQLDAVWAQQLQAGIKQRSINSWVVHSVHAPPDDHHETKPEHEKNCFDHVKDCNLKRLQAELKPQNLTELDEHGLGLIHWATDRNSCEILEFLIKAGANVNMPDCENQTPLHYAASCGHCNCVRILLEHRADATLKDNDGQTCLDVAEEEVRPILLEAL